CAARGCPRLAGEAFVAEKLDKQLDAQVQRWLTDSTRNLFDSGHRRAAISRVFDWYRDDFVRDGGSVVGWLATHAPDMYREWLVTLKDSQLSYIEYSWKLNDGR